MPPTIRRGQWRYSPQLFVQINDLFIGQPDDRYFRTKRLHLVRTTANNAAGAHIPMDNARAVPKPAFMTDLSLG